MGGIGIVTNPNSRRNRRHPGQMHRLGYILGEGAGEHAMTQSADDIEGVAKRFKERGIEILALNGGDGTNHVTLTSFIKAYGDHPLPKVAFLRGGTMNTISNGVGARGVPGQILLDIAEKHHLGKPLETTERTLLKIEYDGQTHYGFIFGNGISYTFLEAYYESGDPNPWVAFTTLSKAIGSTIVRGPFSKQLFRPFRSRVIVDGVEWGPQEYTAIVASSIEQIGLGFRPFIRCRQQPGTFHVLGIVASHLSFAMELPKMRLGMPVSEDKVLNDVANEIVFQSDEPIGFTIDGDLHVAEGELKLSAGPTLEVVLR